MQPIWTSVSLGFRISCLEAVSGHLTSCYRLPLPLASLHGQNCIWTLKRSTRQKQQPRWSAKPPGQPLRAERLSFSAKNAMGLGDSLPCLFISWKTAIASNLNPFPEAGPLSTGCPSLPISMLAFMQSLSGPSSTGRLVKCQLENLKVAPALLIYLSRKGWITRGDGVT
jgi:hypothetical protein